MTTKNESITSNKQLSAFIHRLNQTNQIQVKTLARSSMFNDSWLWIMNNNESGFIPTVK